MNSRTVSSQSDWHRRRLAKNWHECRASLSDWKREQHTVYDEGVLVLVVVMLLAQLWNYNVRLLIDRGLLCKRDRGRGEGKNCETHMKMNWNMMMITDEQKLWIAQDDICCTFEREFVCVSVAFGAKTSRLNFNFLSLIVTVYHLSFYRWLSRRC